MARIEISFAEYESYKAQIKELTSMAASLSQENARLKAENDKLNGILKDVRKSKLFDRIVNWRAIFKELDESVKRS